jgi:hypothetical protein
MISPSQTDFNFQDWNISNRSKILVAIQAKKFRKVFTDQNFGKIEMEYKSF